VDNDQLGDQPVPQAEVVGQDQRLRQVGLVVVAVHADVEDDVAVLIQGAFDRQGDVVAEDLLVGPGADGGVAEELASGSSVAIRASGSWVL
jgi:hypothetical protein